MQDDRFTLDFLKYVCGFCHLVFIVVCLCFLVGVCIFGVFNLFISDVFFLSISFSLRYKKILFYYILCAFLFFSSLFLWNLYIFFLICNKIL